MPCISLWISYELLLVSGHGTNRKRALMFALMLHYSCETHSLFAIIPYIMM